MRCPVCETLLITDHRLDIEVDVCPECRGVWLDRGELNQILDRCDELGTTPSVEELEVVDLAAGSGRDAAGRRAEQSFWMAVLKAD